MPRAFTFKRQSGSVLGWIKREIAKRDAKCGCGKKILAGTAKYTLSTMSNYPVSICTKCGDKLKKVLA